MLAELRKNYSTNFKKISEEVEQGAMEKIRAVCRIKSDAGSLKTDIETSKPEGAEGVGIGEGMSPSQPTRGSEGAS